MRPAAVAVFAWCLMSTRNLLVAGLSACLAASPALAQEQPATTIDFQGGAFVITRTGSEQILTYDNKELIKAFQIKFERMVRVENVVTALFSYGDGNQYCAPASLIAWRPAGAPIEAYKVDTGDCETPPADVTDQRILFMPHAVPGPARLVHQWTPQLGLRVVGGLEFVPSGGTWADLQKITPTDIIQLLDNTDVYTAIKTLLGPNFEEMLTDLRRTAEIGRQGAGLIVAAGCSPSNCSEATGFLAVDPAGMKVYFANRIQESAPITYPANENWPPELLQEMQNTLGMPGN